MRRWVAMTTEDELRRVTVGEPMRQDGPVLLADPDPGWAAAFEREAARVRTVLGDRVLRLEHVGSTSVPSLPAKPIVDMLLVVADPADEPAWLAPLEAAGGGRPRSRGCSRSGTVCGAIRAIASATRRPSESSPRGTSATSRTTLMRRLA
jgi:GrpB-like predicted nucleotidyltransferase (UPF0157 family)